MSGAVAAAEQPWEPEEVRVASEVREAIRDVAETVASELQGVRSLPMARIRRIRTADAVYHVTGSLLETEPGKAGTVVVVVERRDPEPPPVEDLRERFRLTRKEAVVCRLLAQGRSNAEIAEELSISPHTARHHTANVLGKLQTRSREQVPCIVRTVFSRPV